MSNKGTTPTEVLVIYGLTLMICGALAFYASGMQPKAKSSLFIGNGSAIISFGLAAGVRNMRVRKGEPGFLSMMICIHIALIFPLLMASVVSWRLFLAWSIPSKAYLRPYFIGIIVSSLISFATLYTFKPKKNKSQSNRTEYNFDATSTTTDASTTGANPQSFSNTSADNDATDDATSPASITKMNHKSHQSSSDKPPKQHVVRRRPRRATAM